MMYGVSAVRLLARHIPWIIYHCRVFFKRLVDYRRREWLLSSSGDKNGEPLCMEVPGKELRHAQVSDAGVRMY
jgi:hypothetical protein